MKVRHSRYSRLKLTDAREALAMVHTIADDLAAEVARLAAVKVSQGDWARFLQKTAPMPTQDGRARRSRSPNWSSPVSAKALPSGSALERLFPDVLTRRAAEHIRAHATDPATDRPAGRRPRTRLVHHEPPQRTDQPLG
ncbi:MAG: DUF932 domain-containing protein [Solirubrobacteraceae bacterium]